jgi:hypothetical protein
LRKFLPTFGGTAQRALDKAMWQGSAAGLDVAGLALDVVMEEELRLA